MTVKIIKAHTKEKDLNKCYRAYEEDTPIWIPHFFVAPTLFLLGGVLSYSIGSSLDTWGLLIPHQTGVNILPVTGAVFASCTFGVLASSLSDNTVTPCTILESLIFK